MKNRLNTILKNELLCSMGCTEPSSIAFAAAYAKEHLLGDEPLRKIKLRASSNILKNALCVMLPNTNISGIEMILLLGVINCESSKSLTILNNISLEDIKKSKELYESIDIEIELVENVNPLYIEVEVQTDNHHTKTVVEQVHNVIHTCTVDDVEVFKNELLEENKSRESDISFDDIYTFVSERNFDESLIREVRKHNYQIGEYGLSNDVGLNIGQAIEDNNLYTSEYRTLIATTVAGIDSRMSGVPKKVFINSGSGNQGITATVPIVSYAKDHNISAEKELEALTLSHLVTIYIRSKQNRLSSSCGAIGAAAGVSAGLAYMMGCNKKQIEGAITNLLCSNFGVFCDGAKVTCSLKVASAIGSAINSAQLAKNNIFVTESLGVISSSLDETLELLSSIEDELTKQLDKVIMTQAIKNTKKLSYTKKEHND